MTPYWEMSAPVQAALLFSTCFPVSDRDALFERCRADPAWTELLVEASQMEILMAVIDS